MTRKMVRLAAAVLVFPAALVVSAREGRQETRRVPADYATLQEAIEAARPGDTILVEPGTYRERVRLKERVVLRSAGGDEPGKVGLARAEATVIDGGGQAERGPGVVMAEGSVLDGFTITRVGTFDQAEYQKHYDTRGEDLPDGRGAVGDAGAPLAVSIPGVTAVVRNNIVRDNGDAGIGCMGGPAKRNASRIVKNVVFRNMGGGIGIADGATPVVEGNRCHTNLRGGIGNRASAGILVGNECFENVRAGIGIREGARPIVRRNTCYGNRRAGIGIRMEGTSPVVEDNECRENGMAGIGCRDGARPLIRKNRCFENALAGIGARDGARPRIFGNRCYRNKQAGIGLRSGARAYVAHNECYENERAGIGQRGDVETTIEGNHLHHNKAAGLGFEEAKAGRSVVVNNRIEENGAVAVGIHAGWRVRLSDNQLSTNAGMRPVVMVFKNAEATFSDNVIRGAGVAGIRSEGAIRVVGNRFESERLRRTGPPSNAVWSLPGSEVIFLENVVSGWRHALLADRAAVVACGNRVSNFGGTGITVNRPPSPVTVVGNRFKGGPEQVGVRVTEGTGVVEDNRVER